MNRIIPSLNAVILTAFFWVCQLLVMLVSYLKIGETTVTSGIVHSVILLGGWTITVYLAWAIIQLTINDVNDERKFIKSGLIGLIIYILIVILPQLMVMFHVSRLTSYVDHIGHLFERHWRMHEGYDFYKEGSYVTTEHRVNGFEPEAAFLANLLGVCYLPIVIGLTTTKQIFWRALRSRTMNIIFNSLLAFGILLILLLVKTTTGILTAGLGFLIWLCWSRGRQRLVLLLLAAAGLVTIGIAYVKFDAIHTLFNQFLFNKQYTDNRLGGSIGLALTVLSHPFMGVGYGFTSYFTLQNVPLSTTQNFEFQQVYSQFGYPNLSEVLGWFASFGLIIMLPALWLLGKIIAKSFITQRYIKLDNDPNYWWDRGLHISFITMIILATFSSIFVIQIFLWPYLLMFFFYRRHIQRLEQEYGIC
ncbi:hypothetical protein [Convivina intestini]|uniref:hypothetical protein n=1 Tax=Convivina intestini TaxID=1505726 RepID=UPI00200FECE6|nr:hypothetical protein [Convivina intestini]